MSQATDAARAGRTLLPLPDNPLAASFTAQTDFDDGKAFYIPPGAYLDPQFNPGVEPALTSEETAPIEFQLRVNTGAGDGMIAGGRSFLLRRPPLVLVHGLWGSPDAWNPDTTPWHETPGAGFETRLHRVDYEATNDAGFDTNWTKVVATIEGALNEYRTASDGEGHDPARGFNGVRFAATRADVVGHSMGGVLTRVYVSGVTGVLPRETSNTAQIGMMRTGTLEDGAVPYLRADNWGAGSIRRFVSLGSPFDGSSLARAARDALLAKHKAKEWKDRLDEPRRFLHDLLDPPDMFPGALDVSNFGVVPNAIYDLIPGSEFQQLLECQIPPGGGINNYPTGPKRVRWRAVVGIASADFPVAAWKKFIWSGVLAGLSTAFFDGLEDLNGAKGDLVVNKDSQSNGQVDQASVFTSTIHTAIPGMQSFNVQTEVRSLEVAARVEELLSTNNAAEWQGDLKP